MSTFFFLVDWFSFYFFFNFLGHFSLLLFLNLFLKLFYCFFFVLKYWKRKKKKWKKKQKSTAHFRSQLDDDDMGLVFFFSLKIDRTEFVCFLSSIIIIWHQSIFNFFLFILFIFFFISSKVFNVTRNSCSQITLIEIIRLYCLV